MIIAGLRELRLEHLAYGKRNVTSLALVTQEVVARKMQVVDVRLADLAETLRSASPGLASAAADPTTAQLRELIARLSCVRSIRMLDRTGRVSFSSDPASVGEDESDRGYFRAQHDAVLSAAHIDETMQNSRTGDKADRLVGMSRALRTADGQFGGVVVAFIDPRCFAERWAGLDVGKDGSISIFSAGGRLLVRSPPAPSAIGHSFAAHPVFSRPPPAGGRTDLANSPVDGIERVFSVRPVDDYPQLVLMVGRTTEDMLQPWRRFALMTGGGWLLASLLAGGLGFILYRALQRRHRVERELRESEAQREFALSAAGVGHWSMDLRSNVATRSLGHDACFGYTRPVEEWSYETFLAHVHPGDRGRVAAAYEAAMRGSGDYDVEFRVPWPDGSLHWLWSKGRFALDRNGSPYNVAGIQVDISRRRLEAEALRQSERRYDLLFRNSLDGVLQTRLDGEIMAANPAACALFGCSEAELVASGRALLADDGAGDARLRALLDERTRSGSARGEVTLRRRDGEPFEAEVSCVVYEDDGNVPVSSLFVREITERRRAEARTNQQLARLDLLRETTRAIARRSSLTSLFDELVTRLRLRMPVALAGVFLCTANAPAVRVASMNIDAVHRRCDLFVGAVVALDADGLSECLTGELVYEPDLTGLDFDLPRRLVAGGLNSAVLAPLVLDGEVFGVILVAHPQSHAFSSGDCEFLHQLSEHAALAAHQARLYDDLQQAYEQLQRSQQVVLQQERLRALGEMASGVAHDINNAISPVALYIESLLDTEPGLSERARRYLQVIQRSIDDVTHTVMRMREFSRERDPEAGLTAVQFNTLVPQVLELTRARWRDMPQQAGIVIGVDADLQPDLPAVMTTEGEIREALTNLVLNAVDAMPQGGRLVVRTESCVNADGLPEVALAVGDTGVGMSEETRRRCLEPFYTTKGERGTGLGLAMVYGTLQRHGGRIEIDSTPDRGTTVRLLFPVQVPPLPPAVSPAATDATPTLALLLIDDDALLLESLGEILRGEGHTVDTALGGEDGVEAVRRAAQAGRRFDAVITDLGMPHVDGRQVAREVKALSPDTPVVMLTGWGRGMSESEPHPEGVDLLMSKPPKLAELRRMARRLGDARG